MVNKDEHVFKAGIPASTDNGNDLFPEYEGHIQDNHDKLAFVHADGKTSGLDDGNLDTWSKNNMVSKHVTCDNCAEEDSGGNDEQWEKEHLRYGWGRCTPDALQVFNCIQWYVFWVCLFSLVQGFIVNGVISTVITTLERRFDLPSSKSGLIASSNDFLAFILVLLVSFYGSQRHKPRIIGYGVLVLAVGSILFSLPHFFTSLYQFRKHDIDDVGNVCLRNSNVTEECVVSQEVSLTSRYLYVFMLANALHGVGSTPMFTLGTSFIDENSRAEQTPFFLGVIYCIASLGVAAGYMGGGQFLNMYVDIDAVDTSKLDITPQYQNWVGAWWIPFLISGGILALVAIPILGYPKRLPGSTAIQKARQSETSQILKHTDSDGTMGKTWRQFPRAMLNLVRNPTFMCLSLSACNEGMIISGVATFGAKFLQEKFNLPAALAGFVMGIITVPGAGGGMFLGGLIVRKGKLKCRGIIRLNMIAAFLGLLVSCVFWLQCPTQSIAGITTEYTSGRSYTGPVALNDQCNAHCECSAQTYDPVCGMDGSIYFTPCHAGCGANFTYLDGPMGHFKMYTECSCVVSGLMYQMNNTIETTTTIVPMDTYTADSNNAGPPPVGAYQGICMSDCKMLYVVAPLLFVGMMLTFMTCSPTQTATMRCVQENQRSIAIGLQWLLLRLLGTTPGPLILGTIMDSACHVWNTMCGEHGNCSIYQKSSMGVTLFIWWVAIKIVSIAFNFAAQYFYKPPKTAGPDADNSSITSEEEKSLTMEEYRESVI